MPSVYYYFLSSIASCNFYSDLILHRGDNYILKKRKKKETFWFKGKCKIYLLNFNLFTLQSVTGIIHLPSLLLFVIFVLLQRLLSTDKCSFEVAV